MMEAEPLPPLPADATAAARAAQYAAVLERLELLLQGALLGVGGSPADAPHCRSPARAVPHTHP